MKNHNKHTQLTLLVLNVIPSSDFLILSLVFSLLSLNLSYRLPPKTGLKNRINRYMYINSEIVQFSFILIIIILKPQPSAKSRVIMTIIIFTIFSLLAKSHELPSTCHNFKLYKEQVHVHTLLSYIC